jgi:YD repeat-containing protein
LGDSLAGFQTDPTQAQIDQFFANPRGSGSTAASLLGSATTRTIYNVNRYWQEQSSTAPAYSATISREAHVHDLPPGQKSALQINFAYMDGFQRVIQSKTQAKPGPLTSGGAVNSNRWTGSGWTLYNNKGLPVRKYEPFFDDTHEFKFFINGVSTISLYDPLGRVVGTLKPDKTLDKVRFDPWMQTMFDGNDNVLIVDPTADPDIGPYLGLLPAYEYSPSWYTARISGAMGTDEQAAAQKTASHANTPMVVHLDVLGRTFITVKDNGTDGKMTTRSAIDIQGNQYALYDALDREIIRFDFDMTGKRLHQASPDSGERWALCDIGGRVLLSWNSRGFRQRSVYDANRRLTENHLRDDSVGGSSPPESLVAQYVYGESVPNASASNLRRRRILYVIRQALQRRQILISKAICYDRSVASRKITNQ